MYIIAIPSYQRADLLNIKTLKTLFYDILYKYDENINYYDVFDINS